MDIDRLDDEMFAVLAEDANWLYNKIYNTGQKTKKNNSGKVLDTKGRKVFEMIRRTQ